MRGFGGLLLAALMCLNVSCAVRSSTLRLDSVSQEQWHELKASVAVVAVRFGFRSDASEYYVHDNSVGEGWLAIAGYSNRYGGLKDVAGGHAHVEISVFVQPKLRIAKITIIDYANALQTEYLRALEGAIHKEVRQALHTVREDWVVKVVRTLPP